MLSVLRVPELGNRELVHPRRSHREHAGHVVDHPLVGSVHLLQIVEQDSEVLVLVASEVETDVADASHLEDDQVHIRADPSLSQKEVGRLVRLQTGNAGVDTKVGEKAGVGGDRRKHLCWESLSTCELDGVVRGRHEHAGVPVEQGAHILSRPQLLHDPFDHLRVRDDATLVVRVVLVEIEGVGVLAFDPHVGDRVRSRIEHDVRLLNVGLGLQGEVRNRLDP